MAPLVYFVLYVFAMTATCPVRNSCIGKLFSDVWKTLQCLSIVFFVVSIVVYIESYITFSRMFQAYFVKLEIHGPVAILDLVVVPMCMLLMPAVNKLGPLWLLLKTTTTATRHRSGRQSFIPWEKWCCCSVACGLRICLIPIVLGGVYSLGFSCMFVFSVPFIPLPLLQAINLLGATSLAASLPSRFVKCLEDKLGVDPTNYAKELLGELGLVGHSQSTEDQGMRYSLLIVPLGFIMISPLAVIGVMYELLCLHVDSVSIKDIYGFIIDPKLFVLPSLVDVATFFEDFESIEDFISGYELPPVRLLRASIALSVLGTFIAALKNVIAVGNMICKAAGCLYFETVAVQLLREASQKIIDAIDADDVEALRKLKKEEGLPIGALMLTTYSGTTAALYACAHGQLKVVEYLHKEVAEADFAARDTKGKTAVMYACEMGHLEVVKYLHTNRRNIEEADFSAKDKEGKTAVMYACQAKGFLRDRDAPLKVVEYLHKEVEEADFAAKDKKGKTAVMYACAFSADVRVVEYLHTKVEEADFAEKDNDGRTAAMLAKNRDFWSEKLQSTSGSMAVVPTAVHNGIDPLTKFLIPTIFEWPEERGYARRLQLVDDGCSRLACPHCRRCSAVVAVQLC
eukprot:CAMPEP_0178405182 /NCGR_PEP_ID=MMETSP0689_2-20121128/18268_1 /TAXON_ID=160604 /ORGANISM="Amphidinium massartii, Strain CS-259" /LENGTH=626 /DNA_ID=CAMNT_0020026191 /DNA_START=14 /DNA_END=1892 /DNA_ORIENTATION=+